MMKNEGAIMDIRENIALRIKELRKENHMTQKDLAEKTGLSLSTIIGYENKKREPNSKAMAALEKIFNVSGAYLRGETSERNPISKWDDDEYMDTLEEEYYTLVKSLADVALQQNEKSIKDISDIIIELRTLIKYTNDANLNQALELIKENILSVKRVYDRKL